MTGMDANCVDLSFDNSVFSLDIIKRALYRFADRCSFDVQTTDKQINVTLHVPANLPALAIDELCAKIRNEVWIRICEILFPRKPRISALSFWLTPSPIPD